MNVDELINKLQINENDLNVKTTEPSNELLETLKIIRNCTSCKNKKIYGIDLDEIENWEKRRDIIIIDELNNDKINFELNKWILCEDCEGKKIKKLTDKYGNEEMTRFIYQAKLNV